MRLQPGVTAKRAIEVLRQLAQDADNNQQAWVGPTLDEQLNYGLRQYLTGRGC